MLVTDCVLVADDDCCADGLLAVLRDLPGVVAVLGLPLSNILFASARGRVREYRRAAAGSAGRAVGGMEEVGEGDRKSVVTGRSVAVRVDRGGGWCIKKK